MIPILNNNSRKFTTRDNLGITGATTSLQAELCPVINTVTPRAFYWPFMVWNYYEYHLYATPGEKSVNDFNANFLKRNDYFFVLGNLLSKQPDRSNLVGKDKTSDDIRYNKESYNYNRDYFVARYGGMQYYNAGCDTLYCITSEDNDNVRYSFPKVTKPMGEDMALAFIEAVKDTEYYKSYRRYGDNVPTSVLIEWGNRVNLSMNHLEDCKKLLKDYLFTPTSNPRLHNERLIESAELLRFVHGKIEKPSLDQMRNLLYEDYYQMGKNNLIPSDIKEIAVLWEAVVARQYMAFALEMIWKRLLRTLVDPITMDEWIEAAFKQSVFRNVNRKSLVRVVINKYSLTSVEIEQLLNQGRSSYSGFDSLLENAVKVLISIYNRYRERDDIGTEWLSYGEDVSIATLIEKVDEFKQDTIESLLTCLMKEWILKRHLEVAQNKMYYGRDGFYYYMYGDLCYLKRNDASPDFPGLRLMQLMQVMRDLDMLYE